MSDEAQGDAPAGPPPDLATIAELLVGRYPVGEQDRVSVSAIDGEMPGLALVLESGKDRYEIRVQYQRGRKGRDVWLLLADALDALFGTFIESDRAYHDLPTGSDVEFDGAFFRLEVSRTIPELLERANRILDEDAKF